MAYVFVILKSAEIVAILALVLYARRRLGSRRLTTAFALTLALLFASTAFFGAEQGLLWQEWAKHLVFFASQAAFYAFVRMLIAHRRAMADERRDRPSAAALAPAFAARPLLEFVTREGLQHFASLPLFFVILAFVQAEKGVVPAGAFRRSLDLLLSGAFALALVHVAEFLVESQGAFPWLSGEPIEMLEFALVFCGLGLFALALRRLPSRV
ncbi:hypothetical protein A2856_02905 [Candidatus Uhrbacteria bacterium RIFCSPHIGHO2_01_FULL_63_20]|uniref:Uncharacterized protein n=1 Tax=Candidatus Uhrbacteria bacterium RIFCSPHIGHO2_01_FULL_63_20 TaxID=1802385 RepID=A0A1F7TKW5_9BACT|nr:MAG: hypothetical protein A2856_02905 [Candidatus Uhrbacteria bacterium RIFCSPHIGHO2_01_FULL_63_20]